tara:strand:- start:17307 stop:18872 length:1566 start_codon:yes stop_codon:yes gene_type:complete
MELKMKQVRIRKKIEAKSVEVSFEQLRVKFNKIYVDQLLLQRLLDSWDDNTATNHMVAFFEGHSNIYSIVLIDIYSALEDAKNKLKEYIKEDQEYSNIMETTNYLSDIKDKGFEYLNVDGQHRIDCYGRFIKSKFKLNRSVIVEIETADEGVFIPYDLKDVYFKDMPTSVQNFILKEYKLLVTMIQKGTLENLVNVTIYTNLGEPWNRHEMRVILPSSFNMWLHKLEDIDPLLNKVFTLHISDMSGADYKLSKKGNSLLVSEWVGYIHNVCKGEIYKWPKADMLDNMSSIEGLKTLNKKILKDSKSIIQEMAKLVNSVGNKIIKVKRSTIDNLIILLTIFSNSKHTMNSFGKVIKINNIRKFYDWFVKVDVKLREKDAYVIDPRTKKIMVNPTTNTKLKNSESYNSKCSAKKTDDIKLRMTMLFSKFVKDSSKLFGDGIITYVDDAPITKKQREGTALANNFKTIEGEELEYADIFGKGTEIDVDHLDARDGGGANVVKNMGLRKQKRNRSKGSKVESFTS